jgi:hypothetical protein
MFRMNLLPQDAILHSHRRENLKSYTDALLHHEQNDTNSMAFSPHANYTDWANEGE